MRVVDAGEIDPRAAALDRDMFVQQHPDAHALQIRDQQNGVMVAENGENIAAQRLAKMMHAAQAGVGGAEGLPAIVAGHHAQVIGKVGDDFPYPPHRSLAHVDVQIGEMQDRKAVERGRNLVRGDDIFAQLDPGGVRLAAPIGPRQAQDHFDHGVRPGHILDVQEGQALAKGLRFMFRLDSDALAGVKTAEPSVQTTLRLVGRHERGRLAGLSQGSAGDVQLFTFLNHLPSLFDLWANIDAARAPRIDSTQRGGPVRLPISSRPRSLKPG